MSYQRPFAPLKPVLVAGALGASALSFAPHAQAADLEMFPSGNIYLGYSFGAEDSGFAWGIQVSLDYTPYEGMCRIHNGPDPMGIFGPMLRIGFVDSGKPRITVGGRAGMHSMTIHSTFTAETGYTYQFGEHAGHGLHLGGQAHFALAGVSSFYELGLDEFTVAGQAGFALAPMSCAVAGRPLRSEQAIAELPTIDSNQRIATSPQAKKASRVWENRAQTEWASVPAFLEVAEQLQALGAPASLIHRAFEAASDEKRHAILAAGMSAKIGGGELELGNPKTSHRIPLPGQAGLTRLAVESWIDGCLGEGTAARTAFSEAEQTSDPILQQTLSQIAQDEAHHAGLAWDVMEWATDQGGHAVNGALEQARDLMPAEPKEKHTTELENYGISSCAQSNGIALKNREESLPRLDALLMRRK